MGHCFGRSLCRNFSCFDVVVPKFVMLFGPSFIDIAFAHGAECALHANGAHVDVAQEHGHHKHSGHTMNHVGNLHGAALIDKARNEHIEYQARGHHNDAQAQHAKPEHHFFARIEAVRRHFLAAEQAALTPGQSQPLAAPH